MHMARIFILFVAIGSASQATANEEMIERAKKAVAYDLLDPDAAQFRQITYRFKEPKSETGQGMHVVCGEVNGKNAYGAYTGFRRFFWFEGGSPMIKPDSTGAVADAWDALFDEMCGPAS